MKELLMSKSATNLVTVLAGVKKNEDVMILTDFSTQSLSKVLAFVVSSIEANPILMSIDPTAGHGAPLPESVGQAMKACDVVIAPMKHNIAHTKARKEAQENGTRIIVLPESHEDILLSSGLQADFVTLKPKIESLADILTNGKTARVTTEKGTDFTMSLEGREGRALTGFANTKDISAAHCVEASTAPVEGQSDGVIIVDGSIPGLGLVKEPVRVVVEQGKAVEITGGEEAEKLRDLLESLNDEEENIYNVAEFGIGMNPLCQLENSMLSDEGVFGTVHIALGTNKYIGGTVQANGHYDMVFKDATIEIDDKVVLHKSTLYV